MWRGSQEHGALDQSARSLVDVLLELRNRLRHDEVQFQYHVDTALRCRSLGVLLGAAIANAETNAYGPALALLRSALEHAFVDKLAFLGQRYVQIFSQVDGETWEKWKQERESGEPWTDGITDWARSKGGRVRITREGLRSKPAADGSRQTIGIHYFLLDEYSPFVGPPHEQEHFDDGLSEVEERRDEARRHKFMYDEYLKWSSIKESLIANGFADEVVLRRLDVHYRFLSAFIHPHTNSASLLYGRNEWDWPTYDHYSSELILLYVTVLAVEELRSYYNMSRREPTVEIGGWPEIEALCNRAWMDSSRLWFPGQEPHAYDRFREANRRGFRVLLNKSGEPLTPPEAVPAEEIGYYTNPLERLIALHSGGEELMTGFTYASPWPRPDARLR